MSVPVLKNNNAASSLITTEPSNCRRLSAVADSSNCLVAKSPVCRLLPSFRTGHSAFRNRPAPLRWSEAAGSSLTRLNSRIRRRRKPPNAPCSYLPNCRTLERSSLRPTELSNYRTVFGRPVERAASRWAEGFTLTPKKRPGPPFRFAITYGVPGIPTRHTAQRRKACAVAMAVFRLSQLASPGTVQSAPRMKRSGAVRRTSSTAA
jgi:hypothetical protein